MKKWIAFVLAALLLTGCTTGKTPEATEPQTEPTTAEPITDPGEETEKLEVLKVKVVLTDEDDGVFRPGDALVVTMNETGGSLAVLSREQRNNLDVKPGDILEVTHIGVFLESHPQQFGSVRNVEVIGNEPDRVGLVMQVFDEFWKAQNRDKEPETLAVDLSPATAWMTGEKQAVIWSLTERTEAYILESTFDQLVEDGQIDKEKLVWNGNGVLFEFVIQEEPEEGKIVFDAKLWRGGTDSLFSEGVTAVWKDGKWETSGGTHGES